VTGRLVYGRVWIPMRRLHYYRLIELVDLARLRRAGVPKKQAVKAIRKAGARRFYRRTIRPELAALIADVAGWPRP